MEWDRPEAYLSPGAWSALSLYSLILAKRASSRAAASLPIEGSKCEYRGPQVPQHRRPAFRRLPVARRHRHHLPGRRCNLRR